MYVQNQGSLLSSEFVWLYSLLLKNFLCNGYSACTQTFTNHFLITPSIYHTFCYFHFFIFFFLRVLPFLLSLSPAHFTFTLPILSAFASSLYLSYNYNYRILFWIFHSTASQYQILMLQNFLSYKDQQKVSWKSSVFHYIWH